VEVLTGFPNYPSGQIYEGYHQRIWQRENPDNVPIIRVPLYPNHSRSGLKRILNYVSFAAAASLIGTWLCRKADLMWVYHPPLTVGLAAWWIGLLHGIPFIYEIQDMWPETLSSTGMVSSSKVLSTVDWVAKWIYRRADALIVISPGFKRNLIAKGVPAEKIHIIPNWADEDIYRPVPRDPALGDEFGLAGRFNVMFTGNMGAAQALHHVIEAAKLLQNETEIQFVFIGDGILAPDLKAQAQGLSNVRFISQQPAERIPHFLAWADAALVQLRNDPLFHITIPSKTLTYLACGRPILCGVPGDGADVVKEANAGLFFEPENPAALVEAVKKLHSTSAHEREAMGQRGRETFLQQYTRKVLLERYEQVFAQVIASKK
jgi:colanic acid biosynthesis glycosyl transferase WcaI